MSANRGDAPGTPGTDGPPLACTADYDLVCQAMGLSLEERLEIDQAWAADPPAAARCFAALAAEIRDARARRP